jgi:hypothetical protein
LYHHAVARRDRLKGLRRALENSVLALI